MNLWLANPRGFCAGVTRAVQIAEELVCTVDEPVYLIHEIVHNRFVVDALKARGAVCVESVADVPRGAIAVVSAHGASPAVLAQAQAAQLRLFDATCPLVTKVHLEVLAHSRAGRSVLLVGHRGHVEVVGTLGCYRQRDDASIQVVEDEDQARTVQVVDADHVAYVTQTTLATDSTAHILAVLRQRFPSLIGPHHDDICYATQNRQDAVRMLCKRCALVLVVGAPHSSNTLRMVEIAQQAGAQAHLVQSCAEVQPHWFDGLNDAGLSASASAPEALVTQTVDSIRKLFPDLRVCEIGNPENLVFRLPVALVNMRSRAPSRSVAPSL